ncbi:MAG TPA: ABC transporter permease [Armatimonadota bacterium]
MRTATRAFWLPALRYYRTVSHALDGFFTTVGEIFILLGQSLWHLCTFTVDFGEVLKQMSIIGVNAVPVVLLTVTFAGMVLAFYTAQILVEFNMGNYVGMMAAVTVAREGAPVLSAIVVAARAGSAIAAELGSMVVTEQIDAMRALAVNPIQYLVVPRLVSLVLMLPVITMLAIIVGVFGGYLVAAPAGVSSGTFVSSIRRMGESGLYEVNTGLLKTVFFGAVIALVSCQQGLKTTGGAAGVGRATTRAVVLSIVLIYMVDFILVQFLFPNGGSPVKQ